MSPVRETEGDLFASGAELLICPVNTMGVMGKGLAKEFRKRHSWIVSEYVALCGAKALSPGDLVVKVRGTRWLHIGLMATKDHWSKPSRLEWIDDGLQNLSQYLLGTQIRSCALPAVGCGLGGLPWASVRSIVHLYLDDSPTEVMLYAPR